MAPHSGTACNNILKLYVTLASSSTGLSYPSVTVPLWRPVVVKWLNGGQMKLSSEASKALRCGTVPVIAVAPSHLMCAYILQLNSVHVID